MGYNSSHFWSDITRDIWVNGTWLYVRKYLQNIFLNHKFQVLINWFAIFREVKLYRKPGNVFWLLLEKKITSFLVWAFTTNNVLYILLNYFYAHINTSICLSLLFWNLHFSLNSILWASFLANIEL